MQRVFSYVDSFRLKEPSGEGTNHLRSLPGLLCYTLQILVKIVRKLKEEFVNNQTQSFPYLLDMAATLKDVKTWAE